MGRVLFVPLWDRSPNLPTSSQHIWCGSWAAYCSLKYDFFVVVLLVIGCEPWSIHYSTAASPHVQCDTPSLTTLFSSDKMEVSLLFFTMPWARHKRGTWWGRYQQLNLLWLPVESLCSCCSDTDPLLLLIQVFLQTFFWSLRQSCYVVFFCLTQRSWTPASTCGLCCLTDVSICISF